MQTDNAAAIDQPARSAPPGHGVPDAASGLLVPAACRPVGRMIHQPTPKAGSNGREHQQHSTDPDEQHREATRAVLVGRTVGASIAASHRVVKEEPGCHQGNAENLDGATHVSSLPQGTVNPTPRTRSHTPGQHLEAKTSFREATLAAKDVEG
jgi:hypothetical protein